MPTTQMYEKSVAERDALRCALEDLVEALWDAGFEIDDVGHPVNAAYIKAQKVLGQAPMRPRGAGRDDAICDTQSE